MNTQKLLLASFLGVFCCAAVAQDGADRLQQRQEVRAIERQQAREKVALSLDKKQNDKSSVNSSAKSKDVSQAEGTPTR